MAGTLAFPEFIPAGDRLYLVANTVVDPFELGRPTHSNQRQYQLPSTLWAGVLPGARSIGPPPGDFLFLNPTGAVGPDGALHLAWAEPHPDSLEKFRSASGEESRPRPRRIYHARYREGQWSEPRLIYRKTDKLSLGWNSWTSLQLGPSGTVHLLFHHGIGQNLVHLRRRPGGTWRADTLRFRGPDHELAMGKNDRAALGLVSYGAANGGVLVARSNDGGDTWSDTTVVDRPETDDTGRFDVNEPEAERVRLLGRPSETLHLFWAWNETGEEFKVHQIRHALSTDGGKTWSRSTPIDVPPGASGDFRAVMFGGLLAEVDPCGTPHMLINFGYSKKENTDGEGPRHLYSSRYYYTRWTGGQWSALQQLTPSSKHAQGAALTFWDGSLEFVWSEMPFLTDTTETVSVFRRTRALVDP